MKFKVKTVTVSGGNDNVLEDILNSEAEHLENTGWKIISIMFIGYNPQMERLYQIVLQKD